MKRKRIAMISTGGTIEKTYDELEGVLYNGINVLDVMLAQLRLSVDLVRVRLMNKDSLEMSDADHDLIAQTAGVMAADHDGVIVVHGTDRLAISGERTVTRNANPPCPIIFTGAMRPHELRTSDSTQNLTEALLAVQLVSPGVYVAMHNRVIPFPGVQKDTRRMTFIHATDTES